MGKRGIGLLVAAVVLAGVAPAHAVSSSTRRETTARRPYIVEVGEPYAIGMERLQEEAGRLSELRDYMKDYGCPDYAEIQEIEPQWPWESSEVRVYYLRRNLEVDFAHVIISEAAPNLGVMVFVGDIPPAKAQQIEVALQSHQAPSLAQPGPAVATSGGVLSEALVARIEASAERAARAADEAVAESEAAVRAADKTDSIVSKIASSRRRRR
jgi:hypothetical protein